VLFFVFRVKVCCQEPNRCHIPCCQCYDEIYSVLPLTNINATHHNDLSIIRGVKTVQSMIPPVALQESHPYGLWALARYLEGLFCQFTGSDDDLSTTAAIHRVYLHTLCTALLDHCKRSFHYNDSDSIETAW
jgi:hypothetical protein